MKKLFAVAIVLVLLSCGSKNKNRGELVGVKGKKWHPEKPYGMALIPGGSFIMGKSDDDIANVMNAPTRTVTVRSFYMDETEITNSEYRQFIDWVKDSIVRMKLAILADELGEAPGNGGIGEYAFQDADTSGFTVYQRYMYDNYVGFGETGYEGRRLNRNIDLMWDTAEYPDEFYTEVMDSLYIPAEETYNGRRTIDVDQLQYQYTWLDIKAAIKS
ncbi:MAG: SUMF1/EgtB/PvdO family nonheme iron enzyme, partial [Sinomicrobium sp.]|nr:SUMF1/EgtB/PvdO family nonheme iron enzyme [Sinomicrobium sp.]